jgi:ribosomal protein S18 acetylase RimI-like enzyme
LTHKRRAKLMTAPPEIRVLVDHDPEAISSAFGDAGIRKPLSRFQEYFAEQQAGTRNCFIAKLESVFAAYLTVNWRPTYSPFAQARIPEIQDLNVLPAFRRRGIANLLLDRAEKEIATRSDAVGISVGLHPGYNQAQRLYAKRGYIPDGRGVTYRNESVTEGMQVTLDDDLLLHLTKQLERISCARK